MLDKLKMLIALSEERHFRKAADKLNVSQPTLSAGIKTLEGILSTQLVIRGSRFNGFTDAGLTTLRYATNILNDVEQMKDELKNLQSFDHREIKLAVIPTAQIWAAHFSSELKRKHENSRVTILTKNSSEIRDMVNAFKVDAGLTYLTAQDMKSESTHFVYKERYSVVCANSLDLSQKLAVSWGEIRSLNLALLTTDTHNRKIIEERLYVDGADTTAYIEANTLISILASVASGECITILPDDIADMFATHGSLVKVRINSELDSPNVGLIFPQKDTRSAISIELNRIAKKLSIPLD